MTDLVRFAADGVRVALWNGVTFNPSTIWSTEFKNGTGTNLSKSPWRVADMNMDGLPDVVAFGADGVRVALSNGSSGFLPSKVWSAGAFKNGADGTGNNWESSGKTPRLLVDLDGDGQTDLVGFGSASVQWSRQAALPGVRLISVTDSLGAVTEAEYTVLQEAAGVYAFAPPDCGWPCRDGHGPQQVVSRVWRDTGTGTKREFVYRYYARRFDFFEGPLGFQSLSEIDTTASSAAP
mgnify:CR=1 FL=1